MSEGSTTGIFALVRLAADLGLSPDALKVALEKAFDMMQQNGNAGLSLHMALARLGYQVDGQGLYATLGVFRNTFAGAFDDTKRKAAQHQGSNVLAKGPGLIKSANNTTNQPRPISQQFVGNAPQRLVVPMPQYTPDAITWRSGVYESVGQEQNNTR
jgi:hypothetical protein